MKKEYRFNKEKHLHELLVDGEWKALTGVTNVLSVIAKPALIQWAANEAIRFIRENIIPFNGDGFDGYIATSDAILEEARVAHRKKKEEAGQKGTDVHAIIEQIIKKAISEDKGFIINGKYDNDNQQIKNFIDWTHNSGVKFLDSERHIYSKELFIGGIVDFVCEIDGEVWVGDIKTGSGIYPEHFWQTSAYQMCLEAMGIYKDIKGHIILNLKKDGSFSEKRSVSNEDNKEAFLSVLKIYRIKSKIENTII